MTEVARNVTANYLGTAWSALMGLAFVPYYIDYIGIEAYALLGVFAMLQAWLALLDLGLTPAVGREMARFRAGAQSPQEISDLMRSTEWLFAAVAACLTLAMLTAAPWIASYWLRTDQLPENVAGEALMIAAGVIGARWMSGLYRGAINGLQDQVWLNAFNATFATLRGLGVLGVLAWISPTVQAFFVYQGVLSAIETALLAKRMRSQLPRPPIGPSFSWAALARIWRFAGGVTVIMILATVLTQVDKLLLSRLLPLAEFGHYTLAASMAGVVLLVITPIMLTAGPRLAQLTATGDDRRLSVAYHGFSQSVAVLIIPASLVIALFSDHVMLLWTRDSVLSAAAAPLASLLVLGSMLNGLMQVPYSLQLAHGWTRLTVTVNAVSVAVLIPAVVWGVTQFGAIAAAAVWMVLNLCYLGIAVPVMHQRLLPGQACTWYLRDILPAACGSLAVVGTVRFLAAPPALDSLWLSTVTISITLLIAMSAAAAATPSVRRKLVARGIGRTAPPETP
jgi:O-antigen/teichoic acid export membrane protein